METLTLLTVLAALIAAAVVSYVAAAIDRQNREMEEVRTKARSTRRF